MFIISHCLFEQQRCSHNENHNNKCHPWGLLRVTYYLNTFLLALITLSCDCIVTSIIQFCSTPCFESHSHHFVSQHDISLCPCSVIALAVQRGFFFCHWIGSCYFSPDDSIMHGLYFQCFAHWVRVRADALQSESILWTDSTDASLNHFSGPRDVPNRSKQV